MDVPNLQEGKEYMFRVKAVNEEGESEPLETDHAVLAKDPYGMLIKKENLTKANVFNNKLILDNIKILPYLSRSFLPFYISHHNLLQNI